MLEETRMVVNSEDFEKLFKIVKPYVISFFLSDFGKVHMQGKMSSVAIKELYELCSQDVRNAIYPTKEGFIEACIILKLMNTMTDNEKEIRLEVTLT